MTIFWELRAEDPVIDFRLMKSRNFSISNAMFFIFGFGLFGSTTLIPQMLQQLYGYRAIDAGLVLGPGAFVITLLAPVGAQMIQRRIATPRTLLIVSLFIGAIAMWNYASFNLATDYKHYALARGLQGLGYAFFFVPANIIAYSQLTPDQNNRASSLTNLFRNWGGSFGIAFITTASERRFQYHQTVIGSTGDASLQQLPGHIAALKDYLIQKGFTGPDADLGAPAYLYRQLQHQVSLLSFMDCFRVIGWVTLAAIPLLFLLKKFTPTGKAPVGH